MSHVFDTICPWCNTGHDRATGVSTEDLPNDGDVALCASCGEWGVYDQAVTGALRKPNDDEYTHLAEDPFARLAREAWSRMDKLRKADGKQTLSSEEVPAQKT